MDFQAGVFCGARVYGSESERLFRLYEPQGLEYVCVDVTPDGKVGGMIQMTGVAAHFNVTFDGAREAIRYAKRVPTPNTTEGE